MKARYICSIFIVALCLIACQETQPTNGVMEESILEDSTAIVKPFAKEIFSSFSNARDFAMTNDETEAYLSLQSPGRELSVIMKIENVNGIWNAPEISSFSGHYTDLEPFLSPDNLKLYFASNRPVSSDSTNTKDFDIWYVERSSLTASWSEPINIGAPVNSSADEFYPAVAKNNNLYFTCIIDSLQSSDDIFKSEWINNSYTKPVLLGDGVNTKGAEFNAYISPDESYLIFGGWRRPDGVGAGDLYISKFKDGEWQQAENLGSEINSKQTDFCPFVLNETLYFTSRRSQVTMKEGGFKSYEELLSEINKYQNGFSRIYMTNFNNLIQAED
ncbi:hypothetical protein [Psychroserpens sp.]|uniref:hypothetical protein n=1 Tax=Psychroserpens sp. TaxID=2020870 RepID=UPI001B176D57|nr:hypothetical protein [Psychroserpens sp.]MBO6605245.1 PD40 domain-containing protein [Psychroserpens sp.]MBO6630281.1 PD40 domain-containing protein [Psychroserpens sp.]MBO6653946.1 PD40 domain-containing protein [Psychroserpens sp.]MBO6682267.1 PD40 domain-containing protein [Psychroserpens sp.]MBO6748619.1 PD40 domain-containing protein [Psychroserpens sp.]